MEAPSGDQSEERRRGGRDPQAGPPGGPATVWARRRALHRTPTPPGLHLEPADGADANVTADGRTGSFASARELPEIGGFRMRLEQDLAGVASLLSDESHVLGQFGAGRAGGQVLLDAAPIVWSEPVKVVIRHQGTEIVVSFVRRHRSSRRAPGGFEGGRWTTTRSAR